MACGSVPLVSNQECFKDFLDHECAYFYENEQDNVVACTNWMLNILKDRKSLSLKRAQGLCRAKLFSVDAIVNQLEQKLRALLKQ